MINYRSKQLAERSPKHKIINNNNLVQKFVESHYNY